MVVSLKELPPKKKFDCALALLDVWEIAEYRRDKAFKNMLAGKKPLSLVDIDHGRMDIEHVKAVCGIDLADMRTKLVLKKVLSTPPKLISREEFDEAVTDVTTSLAHSARRLLMKGIIHEVF